VAAEDMEKAARPQVTWGGGGRVFRHVLRGRFARVARGGRRRARG